MHIAAQALDRLRILECRAAAPNKEPAKERHRIPLLRRTSATSRDHNPTRRSIDPNGGFRRRPLRLSQRDRATPRSAPRDPLPAITHPMGRSHAYSVSQRRASPRLGKGASYSTALLRSLGLIFGLTSYRPFRSSGTSPTASTPGPRGGRPERSAMMLGGVFASTE